MVHLFITLKQKYERVEFILENWKESFSFDKPLELGDDECMTSLKSVEVYKSAFKITNVE